MGFNYLLKGNRIADQDKALSYWLGMHPAAAVITRGLEIPDYFIDSNNKMQYLRLTFLNLL